MNDHLDDVLVLDVTPKTFIKNIKAENLQIYKILSQAKNALNALLPLIAVNDPLVKADIAARMEQINDALRLLESIAQGFNAGYQGDHLFYYPEIEYKFINACNLCSDIDETELKPTHIRYLKRKFKSVDNYIKAYIRTRRIKECDLQLFNTIVRFNQLLTERILDEQYFNVDTYDQVIDFFYHRPLEFFKEHKAVSIALGVIGTGLLYYYVIKPRLDDWNLTYNFNKVYYMTQFKAVRQKGIAECGYNAMFNTFILANCRTEKQAKALLQDVKLHDKVIKKWKKIVVKERKAKPGAAKKQLEKKLNKKLTDKEVAKYLKNKVGYKVGDLEGEGDIDVGEMGLILRDDENLADIADALSVDIDDLERPFIVERVHSAPDFRAKNPLKARSRDLHLNDELIARIQRFNKKKQAEYFVLDTDGHYISLALKPDANKKYGVNIQIVDSMNSNDTQDDAVVEIADLFLQKNALKSCRSHSLIRRVRIYALI